MNKKIIFFANTLWFLEKFKYELIKNIAIKNKVICIYLRKGPPYNETKIQALIKNKNVKFYSFKKFILELLSLKKITFYKKDSSKDFDKIIIYNIGPILLSSLLSLHYKKKTVYVLEGLGRIFSSRLILNVLIKILVIKFYKYLFNRCKLIYVLNSHDYLFLVENKVCQINKIITLPGTGINYELIDQNLKNNKKKRIYIDYIGRLITEKGFQKFILTNLDFQKYYPELAQRYKFRIICPMEDILKLSNDERIFLNNKNIDLKPYLVEPYFYYSESRALIVPSSYGEGLSRVVLEASYIGIPILASKIRGIEEILTNNYKYFIKSFNPFCISQQLADLLGDHEYFEKIHEQQKNHVKKNFSIYESLNTFTSNLFGN